MAKFLILIIFSLFSLNLAQPIDGPADYEQDGIDHIYSVGLEIGEMPSPVGPVPFSVSLMKEVNKYEWVGDDLKDLDKSIVLKEYSIHNFTVKTNMPFSQIDAIDFSWQDIEEVFGHVADVNIINAYLTETTPHQPRITKKYCSVDPYPKNWAGSIAGRQLALC